MAFSLETKLDTKKRCSRGGVKGSGHVYLSLFTPRPLGRLWLLRSVLLTERLEQANKMSKETSYILSHFFFLSA